MNGSTLRTLGARSLLAGTVLVALAACGSSPNSSNRDHDIATSTVSTVATGTAATGTEVATTAATGGTATTDADQAATATDAELQQEIDQAVGDAEAAIADAEQMVATLDKELSAAASAAANGG